MTEEEKIFAGQLFCPGDPALKAIKLRAHKLSQRYSQLAEDQAADRAEIHNKVNDAYLKANNQTDGVQSYGRMVDLLIAEYEKEKSAAAE